MNHNLDPSAQCAYPHDPNKFWNIAKKLAKMFADIDRKQKEETQ